MKAIFKYPINDMLPTSKIVAPIVRPLHVDYQDGIAYLWAVVDNSIRNKSVIIARIGTGHPFDGAVIPLENYMNTTVEQSAPYVWHWFYKILEG